MLVVVLLGFVCIEMILFLPCYSWAFARVGLRLVTLSQEVYRGVVFLPLLVVPLDLLAVV